MQWEIRQTRKELKMTTQSDKEKYVEGLFPELQEIADLDVRRKVINCWLIALEDSQWNRIEDMPWVPGGAEFITNVQHTRGVAKIGLAMVKTMMSSSDVIPDACVNLDTVIAGCLLHDVGKLIEYTGPSNTTGELTPLGEQMLHNILGAHLAMKAGLGAEIVHCILSHREPDNVEKSLEAKIVRSADICHAYAMIRVHPGAKFRK
jgi:putative nucleotidyltransferase with HDIG domain